MSNETIGQRIKRLRLDRGLRIIDLARSAHSNHSTLSDLENGRKNTNMFTFIEIGRVLGVSLDYLAFGEK